ncbi:MAG: glycosyltransferase [Solibacillus sp.]
MDKLSVIIPVYNGEKYIENLLEDVLKIEIRDHEVIIVNDGSTDNTAVILQKYASKYKHIKCINQINQGVSSARNRGLQKAEGKYIMFLDADDRINVEAFMKFFYETIQEGAQYSFTGYIEQNYKTKKIKNVDSSGEGLYDLNNFMNIFFDNLKLDLISYPINKIYLKSIIDEHDLKFDESVHFAEDLLFNLDYLQYVNTVYISSTNYYTYQKYSNEDSLSSKFKMTFWESRKLVYRRLVEFCSRQQSGKYEADVNTYAANAGLHTVTQIIESDDSLQTKLKNIKTVISDEVLKNVMNKELKCSRNQKLFLKVLKTEMAFAVYIAYKMNNLKLKIRGQV